MSLAFLLPKWLVDEHAITLATWGLVFVTLLLVLVTLILWFDSIKKGKEQRERWKREDEQHDKDRSEERERWRRDDEIRLEQQKPKFTFGIQLRKTEQHNQAPVEIWFSNLGIVPFHIERIHVRRVSDFGNNEWVDFEAQELVNSKDMVHVKVPSEVFRGLLLSVDLEIWISITSATGRFQTDSKIYSFFCGDLGRVSGIKEGLHESHPVICPKCDYRKLFNPKGILSIKECLQKIALLQEQLLLICPNHSSEGKNV